MFKIKRILIYGILLLTSVSIIGFFIYAPRYIETSRNRVADLNYSYRIPAYTKTLHQSLIISDLHADSLLWKRDLAKESDYGHVDIPRLIKGNVALQIFSVVTKTPKGLNLYSNSDETDNITLLAMVQRWPPRTWHSLLERALFQAEKLHALQDKLPNRFFLIQSKQDLRGYLKSRQHNTSITAGLLSLEGSHALEGDINNLDRLFSSGFRIIGFTHFFDNELGGSAHGKHKIGITPFGLEVLKRAEQLGMFIDLSHASTKLMDDILSHSTRPVLVTHTGVQSACQTSHRNLSDQHIEQVAASGGLIGIGFWPAANCTKDISGTVKAIQHVINLVGEDYVALGSDFDGNVQVPFTSNEMVRMTQALVNAKLSESQIKKIMGENIIRVFLLYLPEE